LGFFGAKEIKEKTAPIEKPTVNIAQYSSIKSPFWTALDICFDRKKTQLDFRQEVMQVPLIKPQMN